MKSQNIKENHIWGFLFSSKYQTIMVLIIENNVGAKKGKTLDFDITNFKITCLLSNPLLIYFFVFFQYNLFLITYQPLAPHVLNFENVKLKISNWGKNC